MIVVDTNIVFPLFVRGSQTDAARKLHAFDPTWVTEPFALIEFSNILTTYRRSDLVSRENAREYFEAAEDFLSPNFLVVPTSRALELSFDYGVTTYDARFLALAEVTGELLITDDTRLRRAAPKLTRSMEEALSSFS